MTKFVLVVVLIFPTSSFAGGFCEWMLKFLKSSAPREKQISSSAVTELPAPKKMVPTLAQRQRAQELANIVKDYDAIEREIGLKFAEIIKILEKGVLETQPELQELIQSVVQEVWPGKKFSALDLVHHRKRVYDQYKLSDKDLEPVRRELQHIVTQCKGGTLSSNDYKVCITLSFVDLLEVHLGQLLLLSDRFNLINSAGLEIDELGKPFGLKPAFTSAFKSKESRINQRHQFIIEANSQIKYLKLRFEQSFGGHEYYKVSGS